MGKIYMTACMKGGCAKTVTTYNLAYSLKELGKKVLCVDFDSQANLSTCFGVENPVAVPVTIGHLMMAQIDDDELPGFKEYIQSILSSKLPTAKRFKRWVTSEVLPAIRRHGLYAVDDMLNNPDALIEALQAYKAERMQRLALEAENAIQKQQLIEMQPKASYYDVVLNSPDLVSITEISKDYGWSAQRMNDYLHTKGVQFKQGGRIWILYQKHAEKGYTSTKTHTYPATDGTIHTKVHTYWTQKGRLFIYDLLKADGILPIIEQEY